MPAALTVDGLSVDFDGFKAVNCVSMIVDEGELRVLLGANGAGKTTLMDLISGKTKSTAGRVFLYDADITNKEEHEIALSGVGRKFQIPSVFKDLTVKRLSLIHIWGLRPRRAFFVSRRRTPKKSVSHLIKLSRSPTSARDDDSNWREAGAPARWFACSRSQQGRHV